MTDNEIVKALECCTYAKGEMCNECPYVLGVYSCNNEQLHKDALDFINRQKAEIERLRESNREMFVTISEQDAKFKKWREECEIQSVLWSKHFESIFETAKETIKAEAIKEFAQAFKVKFAKERYRDNYVVDDEMLDNLVKEMVGESNV